MNGITAYVRVWDVAILGEVPPPQFQIRVWTTDMEKFLGIAVLSYQYHLSSSNENARFFKGLDF